MESLQVEQLVGSVMLLLLVAAFALVVSKRTGLPFTVLLVVTGIALNASEGVLPVALQQYLAFEISPSVILFVFLPTLIFESAFALDGRELRENIGPVLTLAVPGLLISTALIGAIVALVTPIPLPAALLLGSILSATDPVAVIAIFRQLGAPKRLTVLVEGESLLNDATAIVVARLLTSLMIAGYFTIDTLLDGAMNFLLVFVGGALVGWALALIVGFLLGRIRNDALIEITLTTALAYLSFLIAEHLHISGVMATVAAGVTMGGWGRCKISAPVVHYLDSFWEYMAFVANALIFLLVGLRVELPALAAAAPLLAWVILAMLVSRALVVYTLVPLVTGLQGSKPIDRRYQTVIYWGGLRGAIALAIVLSLPDFELRQTFIALVTGAVLFTLLVQGLSMQRLVHWLGLDKPPLADQLMQAESLLLARTHALSQLPELQGGGLFSATLADQQRLLFERGIQDSHNTLATIQQDQTLPDDEQRLLLMRCINLEKAHYYSMLGSRQLGEPAYRELLHALNQSMESLRHGEQLDHYDQPSVNGAFSAALFTLVRRMPLLEPTVETLERGRTERDYEKAWAVYQSSRRVLAELDELAVAGAVNSSDMQVVRGQVASRQMAARDLLDATAQQFPEFVTAMQTRLAARLMINAEQQYVQQRVDAGTLSSGVGERLNEQFDQALDQLRGSEKSRLVIDAAELLRTVPMFQHLTPADADAVTEMLHPHTVPAGEVIIRQHEPGDALFLIARGVIRVCRQQDVDSGQEGEEAELELATLMAGDFFGEMALLNGEPRTATCRAVTPCALYELRSVDFRRLLETLPPVKAAVQRATQDRSIQIEAVKRPLVDPTVDPVVDPDQGKNRE